MKVKRPIVYLLVSLVIILALLLVLFVSTKQSAIENAERACGSFHLTQQEPPYNIKAELLSCSEVAKRTGWSACAHQDPSPLLMWFVSMDGSWLIQGPPNADGSISKPIPIAHCNALIDAITGNMYGVGNK